MVHVLRQHTQGARPSGPRRVGRSVWSVGKGGVVVGVILEEGCDFGWDGVTKWRGVEGAGQSSANLFGWSETE